MIIVGVIHAALAVVGTMIGWAVFETLLAAAIGGFCGVVAGGLASLALAFWFMGRGD